MTKREYDAILCSIRAALGIMETIGCDKFPFSGFKDDDVQKMYCQLRSMCIDLYKKIENASN